MTKVKLCPIEADKEMIKRGVDYGLKCYVAKWTDHAQKYYKTMTAECETVELLETDDVIHNMLLVASLSGNVDALKNTRDFFLRTFNENGYKIIRTVKNPCPLTQTIGAEDTLNKLEKL